MFLGLMQKREGQTINFYGLNPKLVTRTTLVMTHIRRGRGTLYLE